MNSVFSLASAGIGISSSQNRPRRPLRKVPPRKLRAGIVRVLRSRGGLLLPWVRLPYGVRRVRPGGPGWRRIAGDWPGFYAHGPGWESLLGILSGSAGLFSGLLGVGAWLTGQDGFALGCALTFAVSAPTCVAMVRRAHAPTNGA